MLQNQQSANSRDEHVKPSTTDDHIAGVLNHTSEQIGSSGRWTVRVSKEKIAIGTVAEDSVATTSCPVLVRWWDMESFADVWLSEPRGLA